jgi:hypothetical protein
MNIPARVPAVGSRIPICIASAIFCLLPPYSLAMDSGDWRLKGFVAITDP